MLIGNHLLEKHLLEVAEVGLGEGDACCLEVFGQFWGGGVIGANRYGLVITCKDDRGGAVVVDVGVVSVADAEQAGSDCEGHLFALVDEGNSFTGCDVDGAIEAVDYIERAHCRVDKDL